MKKLLPIIVLSFLLLGMVGGAVLAAPGDPCCVADDCGTDESCSGAGAGCNVITGDNTGTCAAGGGAVAGGPPRTIKEYCTLSNNITWKSGTIDGTDCTDAVPCSLLGGETVGPDHDPGVDDSTIDRETDEWGVICLVNTMTTVTNWIFYLMMAFVVVMIVIGGATYMLAAGNPEKAGKGKQIIIYGIIGLVIALVARLIPSVVKMVVGVS